MYTKNFVSLYFPFEVAGFWTNCSVGLLLTQRKLSPLSCIHKLHTHLKIPLVSSFHQMMLTPSQLVKIWISYWYNYPSLCSLPSSRRDILFVCDEGLESLETDNDQIRIRETQNGLRIRTSALPVLPSLIPVSILSEQLVLFLSKAFYFMYNT